uniref:Ionotropic glutamate receptor C-terminal domain-containing protein n=1 Tax=Anopheles gambiae TaxID=7165 RepID=A0A1S4GKZ7_ANOGA
MALMRRTPAVRSTDWFSVDSEHSMEATVAQLGLNSGVPIPTMSVLMRFLILKYYSQYYSFCTVGNDFLQDVPLSRIVLSLYDQLNTSMLHAIDNGCQAFVVDEQGAERFLDLYLPVHDLARQRSLDKSLILLIAKRNQTHLFNRMRVHEAFRELANVLIVVYDEQERPTDLYNTVVRISDVLERSVNVAMELVAVKWTSWKNHSFFPDKARDLNGYVLRTSMCNYLPFTGYERLDQETGNAFDSTTGKRSIWLDGTELQLLVSYCERRNCNIMVFPEDEDEWGDVYPNGTGIGLMGSVAERRTDIAFGAFYLWFKPYNFSSYTATISRSGVTVLVPKPKLLPHWRTPFLSFSWPLWIAVMVTFLVGIIATWLAGTVRLRLLLLSAPTDQPWTGRSDLISEQLTLSDAALMMVGFFVAQSSPIRTDLWLCVCLFASLLLAGFMVSNLYSGGLASVMMVPKYEKSIDTVVDFAATGMKWFGPTPYCLEEIRNASEPHLQQIQKTFRSVGPEEMKQYAHMGGSGFFVEQAQHGNFAPSNFLDRQVSTTLQPLKDYVYTQNCAALITNTNPLRSNLNEYILRVQQSGLLYHLGIRTAIRYLPTDVMRNIERSRMHQHDDGAVRLELGHFLGAFFILGYGLLCASLVFVGELWGTVMMRRWNETFVSKATVVTAY